MLEQITFNDTVTQEQEAFEIIKSILSTRPDYLDKLELQKKTSYHSVMLTSSLFCRLKFSGKTNYIAIGKDYTNCVPSEFTVKKQDALYSAIKINEVSDIFKLSEVINLAYTALLISCSGDYFDCCHKYLQCSDAKECLHDDKIRALACTYKNKIENGIIYYGVNKNKN